MYRCGRAEQRVGFDRPGILKGIQALRIGANCTYRNIGQICCSLAGQRHCLGIRLVILRRDVGSVDQHDVIGLGKDTPIITGSNSDSLIALDPESGDWTRMRVPYPMGFYHRGLDGRIDDPDAGWKGRSLWANYGSNMIWHTEGGKGQVGKMVQFQIRPDALAH